MITANQSARLQIASAMLNIRDIVFSLHMSCDVLDKDEFRQALINIRDVADGIFNEIVPK